VRSRKRCFKASHGTLSLVSASRQAQKANWVRSRKRESLACFPCRDLPTGTVLPCLPGKPTQHCPACQELRNRPGLPAMPCLACLRCPHCLPSLYALPFLPSRIQPFWPAIGACLSCRTLTALPVPLSLTLPSLPAWLVCPALCHLLALPYLGNSSLPCPSGLACLA